MVIKYEEKEYNLKPPGEVQVFRSAERSDQQRRRGLATPKLPRVQAIRLSLDAARTGRGKLLDKLFGAAVEPNLAGPCFVLDYPLELSHWRKNTQ